MISFFVSGRPAPQGSKTHLGGGRMKESSIYLEAWRDAVTLAANRYMDGRTPLVGPVALTLAVNMPILKGKHKINDPHAQTPDLDKLVRGVCDAITGVVVGDDKQFCAIDAMKWWAHPKTGGVLIEAEPWYLP